MGGSLLPCKRPDLFTWGWDNANVVGHVARMLAGKKAARPYELMVDGDLLVLVQKLLDARGPGTTKISKVKGHADESSGEGGGGQGSGAG